MGKKLVELCGKGEWMKAVESLYAKDVVSVEPRAMESIPAEMRGLDQVRGKTDWFLSNHEVHDSKVAGPFVARDTFVVKFDIDVTNKPLKERMQMSEAGGSTLSKTVRFCARNFRLSPGEAKGKIKK